MYSSITFKKLADWTGGILSDRGEGEFSVDSLSTDSRTLKSGDVFLALKGESFDGNLFIQEAAKRGARGVITESPEPVAIPKIQVKDGLASLISIGENLRKLFLGEVFAMTGSAGKSSTKDMVAVLLGENTVSSPASFNNLMGVSRTLCLVKDSTQKLVLEMGMNQFGEIAELCRRFQPHYAMITNIGDAHIGKLGGQEGIFRAKKEMFDFLSQFPQAKGLALNADDPWVMEAFKQNFPSSRDSKIKVLTYSKNEKTADVFLAHQEMDSNSGFLNLQIRIGSDAKEELAVSLPIFGEHHAQNIIAAIAMVRLANVSVADIRQRISKIQPASHRGEIRLLSQNKIVIDETYNSNPKALKSSLDSLKKLALNKRKVLVLGEMRELGPFSSALHDEIGFYLADWVKQGHPSLLLVTVQGDAKKISERLSSLCPQIETHHFDQVQQATQFVNQQLKPEDIVFLKGSRGVKLETVLASLK
ncbi:MAG: UDP-N-acetylmuramoyl-tripeptide--D-alanyl-D-alanine ligase [Deltaproteobacteria bacterium]